MTKRINVWARMGVLAVFALDVTVWLGHMPVTQTFWAVTTSAMAVFGLAATMTEPAERRRS